MLMQHGANKATIPAKNEAMIDAVKMISILLRNRCRKIQFDFRRFFRIGFKIN